MLKREEGLSAILFARTICLGMDRNRVRYRKGECCTFPWVTFDANVAVHQIKIFLHDIQAEADTIKISRVGFLYLLECLENSIHIMGFNPDSGISDAEFNTVELRDIPNP